MKIIQWNVYGYSLDFSPFFPKREGFLLRMKREEGEEGWGEIAPLLPWNKESLQQTLEQIRSIRSFFLEKEEKNWEEKIGKLNLFPSVSFGLQSAIFSLLHACSSNSPSFSLCKLLMGSCDAMRKEGEKLFLQGHKTVKVKIGHLPCKEALFLIKDLKEHFSLRIDVTRAWSLEDSLRFFSHFDKDSFAYVEEPVPTVHDLPHFPFPFALDETFRENPNYSFSQLPLFSFLIYKPTMQGGDIEGKKLKKWAKENRRSLILSSSFESGVGIYHIAKLAERLDLLDSPLGLDTYRYLHEDLLTFSLDFSQKTKKLPSSIRINLSKLREIKDA